MWPFAAKTRTVVKVVAQPIRARYDAAQTTADNRRHWANADGLSANASATPAIRRILRNRARYEVANNSYASGILNTLANDCIGTGPRLQMLLGKESDAKLNAVIERRFAAWARRAKLAQKLRTMRLAKARDGEVFAMLITNENLRHPVKLDVVLIEADQVAQTGVSLGGNQTDGITLDAAGNPVSYSVLKQHPGDSGMSSSEATVVSASHMLHWYRVDRPGQSRGLPEIMPALPLFAQLRRYTLAVLGAAEQAANVAMFMKTTTPAGGEAAEVEPMTEMEFSPNMAVFTPEGWEPFQIKAEQPTTTYAEFKAEILNEIARPFDMPYNIAACNSAKYNYASGRLDHQTYQKSICVERRHLETTVLDRILEAWLLEAVKVYPDMALPSDDASTEGQDADIPHQWFWDGREHVDPAKEANAQATRLSNSTTTLAAEYAKIGKDWETELRQRAREVALARELGLEIKQDAPPRQDQGEDDENEDEKDEQDDE